MKSARSSGKLRDVCTSFRSRICDHIRRFNVRWTRLSRLFDIIIRVSRNSLNSSSIIFIKQLELFKYSKIGFQKRKILLDKRELGKFLILQNKHTILILYKKITKQFPFKRTNEIPAIQRLSNKKRSKQPPQTNHPTSLQTILKNPSTYAPLPRINFNLMNSPT